MLFHSTCHHLPGETTWRLERFWNTNPWVSGLATLLGSYFICSLTESKGNFQSKLFWTCPLPVWYHSCFPIGYSNKDDRWVISIATSCSRNLWKSGYETPTKPPCCPLFRLKRKSLIRPLSRHKGHAGHLAWQSDQGKGISKNIRYLMTHEVYLAKVCLICSKQYAFLSFLALYFSRFLWHAYHRLPSPWQWTKSPCYPMLAGWIRNKRGPLTQLDYRPLFLLRLRSISPKFRYHHCNYG